LLWRVLLSGVTEDAGEKIRASGSQPARYEDGGVRIALCRLVAVD